MKKLSILLFVLCYAHHLWADGFEFKSKIDSVTQAGFYKIVLNPDIISVSKSDYSDIRIVDSRHNEIPYILILEQPATERTGFHAYEIIENKYLPKQAITRIVVSNSTKSTLSGLSLIVRNSDVEKEITLKGSDDQRNWYIIKRSFPVVSSASFGETSAIVIVDFPKSNYRFFELTMNDKKKDPLQVTKVGYYDLEVAKGMYTQIPTPVIKQTDSAGTKETYISVKFSKPYEISKLEFVLKGPEFYLRDCSVGRYVTINKNVVFEEIGHFTVSSKGKPVWEFNKIKTDGLTIIIHNSDNAPLKMVSVKAYQLNKYLIAKLEPGETYYLFTGQKKLSAPEYDLKYFSDSLPSNITVIKTGQPIPLTSSLIRQKPSFFNSTFLWVVIVVVILLLAWLSIKLTKEMSKDSHTDNPL